MLALACGGISVASALDAGADDAVQLPASAGEIAARLAARLRARPAAPLVIGELRIDPVERRVTRAGRAIALLPREYALLLCLAHRAGRCVSRAELLAQVWRLGFDPGTNVVQGSCLAAARQARSRLRRADAAHRQGRGYCLTAPA